jgi:hypothetical protein
MNSPADHSLSCPEARAAAQVRLDEPLPAGREAALDRHCSACKPCASYRADLDAMRDALRTMPPLKLPVDTLEKLRSATRGDDTP